MYVLFYLGCIKTEIVGIMQIQKKYEDKYKTFSGNIDIQLTFQLTDTPISGQL